MCGRRNYQKRKKLLRFQTKMNTSRRTKTTQKLYVWKEKNKKRKKNLCVFNENGYVWTGPDSINLDAIKIICSIAHNELHLTECARKLEIYTDLGTLGPSRIDCAHDAPLSLTLDWLMKTSDKQLFSFQLLIGLRRISLHVCSGLAPILLCHLSWFESRNSWRVVHVRM